MSEMRSGLPEIAAGGSYDDRLPGHNNLKHAIFTGKMHAPEKRKEPGPLRISGLARP